MPDNIQNEISQIIKVEISDQKMKAFLIVKEYDTERFPPITLENLYEVIEKSGVKFGVNRKAVLDIVSEKKRGEKILIAEGLGPAPGEDAKFEFYFPTEKSLRPQIKDGHVDYKEVNIVSSVEKDAVLVKKIPSKLGPKGFDVFGNEIAARNGKDINIVPGQGTYKDPEDNSMIRSSIEGVVFYNPRNYNIQVQKLYVIPDSVDYATGNVHVKSSVEIKGDVKPGFSVTTPYNIQVKGVIELATISCEGTLTVKDGIIGDGSEAIKVGGDLHSGYINNQHVKCGGSVYVSTEIRNAVIECDDEVVVVKGNGIILGGKITATNKVSAPFIGNTYNIPTEIEVGVITKYKEEYLRKEVERLAVQKQIDDYKQRITLIAQKSPDSVKDSRLSAFRDKWNEYSEHLEKIEKEMSEFKDAYYNVEDPVVCVTKTVYPGTIIKIKHVIYEVKDELTHVIFRLTGDEVTHSNI